MNNHRLDITGLRTIAVLAVIFFHAEFPSFAGGYVGVDVFFVISGYLITGKILRELDQERFSVWRFYVGRLRRLMPALVATTTLTFGLGVLVLSPDHLVHLAKSSVAGTFWVSNILFWLDAGYWDLESSLKPLLHTWSLGVEEQFYFFWPGLLIGLSWARRRWVVWLGLAVLGVTSVIAAELWIAKDANAAFYLTPFRVGEFAIGGLVLLTEQWKPRRKWLLEIVALTGGSLVSYAIFTFTAATRFPGWSAMIACTGTAALIYSGEALLVPRLLRNRLAVWIGLRAYSLYLVHWPLFTLYRYWRVEPISGVEEIGLIGVAFFLADLLYRGVEERFRYPPPSTRHDDRIFAGAVLALGGVLCLPAALSWWQEGWDWRIGASPDPSITAKLEKNCVDRVGLCEVGTEVVLVGDSHAKHWTPAVGQVLQHIGVSGTRYPLVNNCKFLRDAYFGYSVKNRADNECRRAVQEWFDAIERDNPRVVILASFWPAGLSVRSPSGRILGDYMDRNPTLEESQAYFEQQLSMTIGHLKSHGRKVVVLGSTPLLSPNPLGCLSRPSYLGKIDCASKTTVTEPATHRYLQGVFDDIGADPEVFYFDTFEELCPDGECRLSDRGVSLFRDRHHLSKYGSLWFERYRFGALEAFLRQALRDRQ